MSRAYLYPISAFVEEEHASEYIESFMDYLEPDVEFLNRNAPSTKGILDLMKYFRQIDYLFLHWIEDLPDKRGGMIQTVFFIFMVFILKLRKTRVIWVMHNKESHYRTNLFLKGVLTRLITRRSDYIITHSKEGQRILEKRGIDTSIKGRYFAHPLVKKFLPESSGKSFDILVWGTIIPYKGVDKFLEYLYNNMIEDRFRILLAGKVKPDDYGQRIRTFCRDNIILEDRYIPIDELEQYMADSKVVLFTYAEESVLSSGALMESIAYGMKVVAPHTGAFRDLYEEGLIVTYRGFEEIVVKLESCMESTVDISYRIDQFINENDWKQFSSKLKNWIGINE